MKMGLLAATSVAGCCCTLAAAQSILPLSASRDIFVESFVVDSNSYSSGYDSDVSHSDTVWPFNRTLDRFLTLGAQSAKTLSSQNSSITSGGVSASIKISDTVLCPNPGFGLGHSTNTFTTTFRVDRPTRYHLTASIGVELSAGASAVADVVFIGPDGTIASAARSTVGQSSLERSGLLAPGIYRIDSRADGTAQTAPSPLTRHLSAAISFQFTPLCLADFNASGFVDFEDYAEFIAEFDAGSELADTDLSGFVDTDDFNAFVSAFSSGC